MLYGAVLSVVICLIALGLGYGWVKATHYPFTVRQRKMWIYYVLVVCALPVFGEVFLAMKFWVMPLKQSGAVAISLLLVWMVIAFYLVCRMSRPN
jgi:hypothetical protein